MNRASQIIRTSVIGIIANVMLAAFKATVGVLASSVAIAMDKYSLDSKYESFDQVGIFSVKKNRKK